jgi:hypothetical protein
MTVEESIERAAVVVQRLAMVALGHGHSAGTASSDTPTGLYDGLEIIRDYLKHNEVGVAFNHLLYVVEELDLALPEDTHAQVASAGCALALDSSRWAGLRLDRTDSSPRHESG